MLQMRDNRLRLFYTVRVPMPFVYENTLLQVRWHRCWKNPGDLVIFASHTNEYGIK